MRSCATGGGQSAGEAARPAAVAPWVQPHAYLLVLDPATGRPCAASRSFCVLTGRSIEALSADAGLTVFDAPSAARIVATLAEPRPGRALRLALADGRRLRGQPHPSDGLLMLDLEHEADEDVLDGGLALAHAAMRSMREIEPLDELCQTMVDTLAAMTGHERTMLYRFDEAWNREVVAENRADPSMPSFLGLKFPAAHTPERVRALFRRNRLWHLADVGAQPSPVEPPLHPRTGVPLDISGSQLRAPPPEHVTFLAGMGTRAAMVIAVMRRSALWGLIACHHDSGPHAVPPRLRALCSLLGEVFSTQLSDRLDAAHAQALAALDARLRPLAQQAEAAARVGKGEGLPQFLDSVAPELLGAVQARSIHAWIGHEVFHVGPSPPMEALSALLAEAQAMGADGDRDGVSTDSLPPPRPGAARIAAGMAFVAGAGRGEGTMALRDETTLVETWAADPDDPAEAAPVAIQRIERRDRCLPWTETDRGKLRIIGAHLVTWRDIFEEEARREALVRRIDAVRAEANRLALVAERANDSVLMIDLDGRITWVNRAFERLTGYTLAEVRGQSPIALLTGPQTDWAEVQRMREAVARQEPVRCTLHNHAKGGRTYWVEIDITPVPGEDGEVQHYIAIERDVTEARDREAALAAALAQAQESDRLKDEFLRVLSHEIRTPLNGVLGGVAVLVNGLTDERRLAMARAVTASGQKLLDMFTEMLEIARTETEQPEIRPEPCLPRALLERALAAARPAAERRGLDMRIEGDRADMPVLIEPVRMGRILGHLVANAVKFTARGWVVLRACTPHRSDAAIRFEVLDSGPGVPEAMRQRIFDPFSQIDSTVIRLGGGLGLGLAVCRRLTTEMGGRIGVETAPGGGALFWVEV